MIVNLKLVVMLKFQNTNMFVLKDILQTEQKKLCNK